MTLIEPTLLRVRVVGSIAERQPGGVEVAEQIGMVRFHLEVALSEADRSGLHAVAALVAHALALLERDRKASR